MKWKEIPNFPEYEINEAGVIKRLIDDCNKIYKKGRILSQWPDKDGYMKTRISNAGKPTSIAVHRLVAITFLGPAPEGKNQINHKDGCKTNNHYSNLEWCDASENIKHSFKLGLNKGCGGDKHWSKKYPERTLKGSQVSGAKLTEIQVKEIKKLIQKNVKDLEISKIFNISRPTITYIRLGKLWKHVK